MVFNTGFDKQDDPTLEAILARLSHPLALPLEDLYRQVASGERDPMEKPLPKNVQILACQAMCILFEHSRSK